VTAVKSPAGFFVFENGRFVELAFETFNRAQLPTTGADLVCPLGSVFFWLLVVVFKHGLSGHELQGITLGYGI
jgi:hypothetical protein